MVAVFSGSPTRQQSERRMEAKLGGSVHMLFFPFTTKGHILPLVEIAKLFAARGAVVTLLLTPADAAALKIPADINIHVIHFPEEDHEETTLSDDDFESLLEATARLRRPFDDVLRNLSPDCVVSDMLMPWTYQVSAAHGIPRIIFEAIGFFSSCLEDAYLKQNPMQNLAPDAKTLLLHGLPHRIEFLRSQFPEPDEFAEHTTLYRIWNEAAEVKPKCYGVVVNSFYDLEPDYVEHCRNAMGVKAWGVGPVAHGGNESDNNEHEDLFKWLDSQKARSVVYMCFGSMCNFSPAQLKEMAIGLRDSGHLFVWAVQQSAAAAEEDWIPDQEGFEESGVVIRGWVPQPLILKHPSVGGFVTHCGWNSVLQGIVAGLPMATWPLFADNFYSEKLLVDILGIGVRVGAVEFGMVLSNERNVVEAGKLEAAVRRLMVEDDEEADERRCRARDLGLKAKRAVEKGGSSYNDVGNLIQELRAGGEEGLLEEI